MCHFHQSDVCKIFFFPSEIRLWLRWWHDDQKKSIFIHFTHNARPPQNSLRLFDTKKKYDFRVSMSKLSHMPFVVRFPAACKRQKRDNHTKSKINSIERMHCEHFMFISLCLPRILLYVTINVRLHSIFPVQPMLSLLLLLLLLFWLGELCMHKLKHKRTHARTHKSEKDSPIHCLSRSY